MRSLDALYLFIVRNIYIYICDFYGNGFTARFNWDGGVKASTGGGGPRALAARQHRPLSPPGPGSASPRAVKRRPQPLGAVGGSGGAVEPGAAPRGPGGRAIVSPVPSRVFN